ncbi:MAG: carbohydrate ABC transporter permease, partial [Chloroflexi bacterium]
MRRGIARTGYDVIGVLVFAVMMFPIYWMVSTALKPGTEILSLTPYWVPNPITFDNFKTAIAV